VPEVALNGVGGDHQLPCDRPVRPGQAGGTACSRSRSDDAGHLVGPTATLGGALVGSPASLKPAVTEQPSCFILLGLSARPAPCGDRQMRGAARACRRCSSRVSTARSVTTRCWRTSHTQRTPSSRCIDTVASLASRILCDVRDGLHHHEIGRCLKLLLLGAVGDWPADPARFAPL
jgi:hypothetical protein